MNPIVKLYVAVTPDRYELPLYVADSAQELAAWAGVLTATVYENCSRNRGKPPIDDRVNLGTPYRMRKIEFVEDEDDQFLEVSERLE